MTEAHHYDHTNTRTRVFQTPVSCRPSARPTPDIAPVAPTVLWNSPDIPPIIIIICWKNGRAWEKRVGFEWMWANARGCPKVITSTYTEMYVCQCINGREISTTLKIVLNCTGGMGRARSISTSSSWPDGGASLSRTCSRSGYIG
jgi:hypothetical protein